MQSEARRWHGLLDILNAERVSFTEGKCKAHRTQPTPPVSVVWPAVEKFTPSSAESRYSTKSESKTYPQTARWVPFEHGAAARAIRHDHGSVTAQQRAPETARAHLLVKAAVANAACCEIVDKASTDVKSKAAKSARPLSSTLEHENMLFSMTAACWRPLSAYE